jgi:hypothetical protein
MAVYKRGAKGVFYMNFTVNGTRVFKSTGKNTKKEAKQAEANERQRMLNESRMSPLSDDSNGCIATLQYTRIISFLLSSIRKPQNPRVVVFVNRL